MPCKCFHALALNPADPGHVLSVVTRSAILLKCLPHDLSLMVRSVLSSHVSLPGTLPGQKEVAAGKTPRYLQLGTTAPDPFRLTFTASLHSSIPHAGTTAVLVLHRHLVRCTLHCPPSVRPLFRLSPRTQRIGISLSS